MTGPEEGGQPPERRVSSNPAGSLIGVNGTGAAEAGDGGKANSGLMVVIEKVIVHKRSSIAGAAVILLVCLAVIVVWTSGDPAGSAVAQSRPLTTRVAAMSANSNGFDLVFPTSMEPAAERYVDTFNQTTGRADFRGVDKRFAAALYDGAFSLGGMKFEIEVRNPGDTEAEITNVRILARRSAVPLGTAVLTQVGGAGNDPHIMDFYLDQPLPVAMVTRDEDTDPMTPFFDREHISVPGHTGATLIARVTAQAVAATFTLAVDYTLAGRHRTSKVTMTPDGKPFRVAALACLRGAAPVAGGMPRSDVQTFRARWYGSVYDLAVGRTKEGFYTLVPVAPGHFAATCRPL